MPCLLGLFLMCASGDSESWSLEHTPPQVDPESPSQEGLAWGTPTLMPWPECERHGSGLVLPPSDGRPGQA